MNNILLKYLNNNLCVTLPNHKQSSSDYLKLSNFLSEYLTDYEKLEVLRNLGVLSLIEENNKTIDNKLGSYVTLLFLLDHFVKKEDIYNDDEDEDYYFDGEDWSKSIDESLGSGIVDDELSLTSTNPILNRVVAQALSEALNEEDVLQVLREYTSLTKLIAGYGIDIKGNVISTTLDVNPFIVVNSLPTTNINPNKIYLVHSSGNIYILYKYVLDLQILICPTDVSGEWIRVGEISIGIDLSSLIPDDRYLPIGDYVTTYQLNKILKKYVKKYDVYTPKIWGEDDDDNNEPGEENPNNNYTPVNIIIDSYLSKTSTNPVLNRIITLALEEKQDILIAGEGITIENGIISSTFDTSLYEIVTSLPLSGKSNKIYLLETADGRYKEYIYSNNRWVFKGYRDFGVDLTLYAKKSDLDAYAKTSYVERYYATKEEISGIGGGGLSEEEVLRLINAALEGLPDTLETLREILELLLGEDNALTALLLALSSKANITDVYTKSECDTLFQPKGNYITKTIFDNYKAVILPILDTVGNYDESLSLTSTNAVLNKVITKALNRKASYDDLDDYLTIETFNGRIGNYNPTNNFKTVNSKSIIGTGNIEIRFNIDSELSNTSLNPVQNKVINLALSNKVDKLTLANLLYKLTPGTGITIDENNVISTIIDINPFVIVDELPEEGLESKLYLVKDGNTYVQYVYENGEWIEKGVINFNIDLTQYLKSDTADLLYQRKGDFLNSIDSITEWITNNFVKKEDIYTPYLEDFTSDSVEEPYEPVVNPVINPTIRNTYYESSIANGVTTNLNVGNINLGTDIALLKGKTFSELFDMLLFKEIWPNADARHTISMTIPSTIVKVGSPVVHPTIVTQWNLNILPINTIESHLDNIFEDYNGNITQINNLYNYTTAGIHRLTLDYDYPSGKQTIISNYNNSKEVTIPADSGTIEKIIKVTYPWYVNGVEQSTLVPIGTLYNGTITLSGTPVIEIPGYPICSIKANLGLGFMDVNWNKTIIDKNGVPYSVWTKPDTYSLDVEHLIQFTISFDSLIY